MESEPEPLSWWKVDFHLHAAEDPYDELDYSTQELLYRAKKLGFHALAITLHNQVFARQEAFDLACRLGLLLIPAAEMRIEGADVVILNITPEESACLKTWDDLAALRQRRGSSIFVFAPHPFYILGGSIGERRLIQYIDLFDGIELSHLYTRLLNRNRGAIRVARQYNKPLIANSDLHRLEFFGRHYSLVEAPQNATAEDLFAAIRAHRIRTVCPAYPLHEFLEYAWWIFARHEIRLLQARLQGH